MEDSARNDVRWFMEQKKNLISYKLLPLFQTDWAISSNCSISITMSNAKCEISSPLSPSFSQEPRSLPHSLYLLAIQMFIQSISLAANTYFFLLAFVHFDVGTAFSLCKDMLLYTDCRNKHAQTSKQKEFANKPEKIFTLMYITVIN